MKKKSGDGETSKAKKAAPAKKAAAAKKPAAKKPAAARKGASSAKKSQASKHDDDAPTQIAIDTEALAAAAEADEADEGDAASGGELDGEAIEVAAEDIEEDIEEVELAPAAPMTDEERELAALYGDDLAKPATAHGEFRDKQSADEDRQLMPEINARDERKHHWQDRRDERRRRRDERRGGRGGDGRDRGNEPRAQGGGAGGGGAGGGGGGGGGNSGAHAQPTNGHAQGRNGEARGGGGGDRDRDQRPPMQQRLPLPGNGATQTLPAVGGGGGDLSHDALARVGTPLGDAAAAVFAQLRNGQPLPVRQLAQMMRKRNIVEHEPERLAPQLKAELLGDERSYRALGLRPRIVYRGRDLFAPGPVWTSTTADAEAGFAAALSRLAGATHRALAQRIARATPAGFERLVHAYLVAAGYRDIDWVKRVGEISYATATAPGLGRMVLVSARSGDAPIDRRGIGELRVGVEAKDLVAGILFSARELSEDAERELERAGRSIAVMCGDQLVAALITAGVGVVSAAAPLHYVDDQLLDELLAG